MFAECLTGLPDFIAAHCEYKIKSPGNLSVLAEMLKI